MESTDAIRVHASQWFFVIFSAIVLLCRYFIRITRTKKTLLDDHVLIVAWLCLLASVSLRTDALRKSSGKELSAVEPALRPEIGKLNAIAGPIAIGAAMLSKTSFALTLLRVVHVMTGLRITLWLIIVSINLSLFLSILTLLVSCKPVEKGWNPALSGTCWPHYITLGIGLFASAYSACMDLVLVGVVWWVIWGIRISKRDKIGVAVGMSMGIFAGVTGAVKCIHLANLDFFNLYIWEGAEIFVTIVATSIPILRVFIVDKAREHTFGSSARSRRQTETGNKQLSSHRFERMESKHVETFGTELQTRDPGAPTARAIPEVSRDSM